jgi:cell division transport system ATP-binding protein
MVTMENVSKVYDNDTVALDDVSIDVKDGEFAFIVGQSGSGKSTFIRLLTKELEASDGRIVVGGRDLTKMRARNVPDLRRAIGCVFQDYKLLPERNAYQNVAYAMQVIGASPKDIKRSVPEVLALVGLEEKGHRMPGELSGGEQQRVSIARAVVNQPSLMIADEPTGNLDPETSAGIMQVIYRINQAGTTVLMATHDRDLVDRMEMRVVELEDGRIVRDQRQARYRTNDN